MEKICKSCGLLFRPRASVLNQRFCSSTACQKKRRRQWQKKKRSSDKAYRENQKDAQKAWLKRNKGYWKKYRKDNPKYTERNRKQQIYRNQRRMKLLNMPDFVKTEIAKMDVLTGQKMVKSGFYRLTPLSTNKIAKMDVLIVKIDVIGKRYNQLHG